MLENQRRNCTGRSGNPNGFGKGQGPLNMLFANRIYAMKEAGQDVRKEQFEQAYALSEMFGDLELQNSLKYYIQKNWPSKEKIH